MDITQGLIIGIGALSTVVATLYHQTQKHYEFVTTRLTDCETDRQDLWEAVRRLEEEIDERTEEG